MALVENDAQFKSFRDDESLQQKNVLPLYCFR